jgi:hypothetical protein
LFHLSIPDSKKKASDASALLRKEFHRENGHVSVRSAV